MYLVLVVLLVLILVGLLPVTGLHGYGYTPSGLLGILVIVLIVFLLLGRI